MKKEKSISLFKIGSTIEEQKSDLFRQALIKFIKKHDKSQEATDFSGYNMTQLVLLKVNIEIQKK